MLVWILYIPSLRGGMNFRLSHYPVNQNQHQQADPKCDCRAQHARLDTHCNRKQSVKLTPYITRSGGLRWTYASPTA